MLQRFSLNIAFYGLGGAMNDQSLISVIIPIYNMEKYLSRCLDSVCNNTYRNLEIICINDGSTDSSIEILKEYKKKDDRIKVINQENKKVSASRNTGLDAAKGKWIAMIDPDDWIHPQYFEILHYVANVLSVDISICAFSITHGEALSDELINIRNLEYKEITKTELNNLHAIRSRVWGRLYRKEIIGDLRFISGSEPVEDELFNNILNNKQLKYSMTMCKLYYYFMREGSAIHTNTGRQSLVYTKYMILLIEQETNPTLQQEMVKRCYNMLLASRYRETFSKDYREIKKQIDIEFTKLKKYRRNLSIKDQFIYIILCINPIVYRTWRVIDDPTLREYEKNQKKNNKKKYEKG